MRPSTPLLNHPWSFPISRRTNTLDRQGKIGPTTGPNDECAYVDLNRRTATATPLGNSLADPRLGLQPDRLASDEALEEVLQLLLG
jgi:hypothetical protein